MSVSTTCQHDTYPMPVQCWSTFANTYSILGSVLCWCQCVHSIHADTHLATVKCWATVPALASIYSTPGSASCWLSSSDYNAPCKHNTPTQCPLNVGPQSVMPVQPRSSILSQRMSIRRNAHKITGHSIGLMLGKWRKQPPDFKVKLCQPVG